MRLLSMLIAASTVAATAGPSKTIDRLMNEPVSKWDLGMYRTEQYLQDYLDASVKRGYLAGRGWSVQVTYNDAETL